MKKAPKSTDRNNKKAKSEEEYKSLSNTQLAKKIADLRAHQSGREAKRALEEYALRKNLRPLDLLNVIVFYSFFNDHAKVLSFGQIFFHKPENQKTKTVQSDEEEAIYLAGKMYYVFSLLNYGCFFLPQRIHQDFLQNKGIEKVMTVAGASFPGLYTHFLSIFSPQDIIPFYEGFKFKQEEYDFTHAALCLRTIRSYILSQQYTQAKKVLDQLFSLRFNSFDQQRTNQRKKLASYFYKMAIGDFSGAKKEKRTINEDELNYRDKLLIALEELKNIKDDKKEFQNNFRKQYLKINPVSDFDILIQYLLEKKKYINLSNAEKIYLECSINPHKISQDQQQLKIIRIKKNGPESLELLDYLEERKKILKNKTSYIDLLSNTYFSKEENQLQALTDSLSLALKALIGASSYGIHLYALADCIYRDEVYVLPHLAQKINYFLTKIHALGIETEVKKQIVRVSNWEDDSFPILYLSTSVRGGQVDYLKMVYKKFHVHDVCETFAVKIKTAYALIQQWQDEKRIQPYYSQNENEGRKKTYCFV